MDPFKPDPRLTKISTQYSGVSGAPTDAAGVPLSRGFTAEDVAALRTVLSIAKVGLEHRRNEDAPIFERAIADVEQFAQEIEDALP